jgi:hypothetical protein
MALLSKKSGIITGSVFGFLLILLLGGTVYAIKKLKAGKSTEKSTNGGRRKRPRQIKKRR